MKNKFIKLIAAFFTVFTILNTSNAQVKTKVFYEQIPLKLLPVSKTIEQRKNIKAPAEFYVLKLKAEEMGINNPEDIRFAYSVLADIDFLKEAKMIEENGIQVYSLTLIAEGALNLSVQFNQFKLSANSSLAIYTKYELTDSITAKENNESNVWATRVYQGNEVSIVLKTPTSEKVQPMIKIDKVNFGYKQFGVSYDFGNPGASAPCNINANCAGGNGWDNEKNSIAIIVVDGAEQCTGSLIMNSCNTNIPYFLTANHCLDAGNLPNWVFQFQTLSTDCATNIGWREDIQFNGCTLRANSAITDFALLQLNNTPPVNSGLFYSGWSRQTTGNTSTTILHHPAGDLMKISRDINAPVALNSLNREVWQLDLDLGIVQGEAQGHLIIIKIIRL